MKIGMMNNPRNSIVPEIEWAASKGFDFVDLTIELPSAFAPDAKLIEETSRRLCLELVGHTDPNLPYAYPVKSIAYAIAGEFERFFDIFQSVGVKKVNVHPSYLFPVCVEKKELIEKNISFLKTIESKARERGLTLMLENFTPPFDRIETFKKIFDAVPGLMLHIDVGHINICKEGDSTEKFFESFHDRIIHMHFSDNRGIRDDHMPIGTGSIDWKKTVETLKAYNYDSTITLEIFTTDLDYLVISRDKLLQLLE